MLLGLVKSLTELRSMKSYNTIKVEGKNGADYNVHVACADAPSDKHLWCSNTAKWTEADHMVIG